MLRNDIKYDEILFGKCCDDWLNLKQNSVKESSYLNYKFAVEKHIKPILGELNLVELDEYDMNQFINIKKSNGENLNLKDLICKLKSILRYVQKKYRVEFDFDFNSHNFGYYDEIELFTEKQRKRLSKRLLLSDDIKDLGVLISLYSGLRIGEICGLKWKDIDLENKVIYVQRTVQRVYVGQHKESKVIITPPKTRKSQRKIPISKVLVTKLKQFKKDYSPESFVITGVPEKSVEPLGYRYTYRQILKRCRIKYKKFHTLRHTFATRCIRVGMDVKSLSEVLGHSNISITMNIYVHSSYEVKKKFIDKL